MVSPPVHTETMKTIVKTQTFQYSIQSGLGRFRKDADLLQVCFHCDGVDDLDLYIMPEKGIEPSATKVHRLSVSYSTGEKRL